MERKMKWIMTGYITMVTILVVLFLLQKNYHAAVWASMAIFWFWQLQQAEARNHKLWKEHMQSLEDHINFLDRLNKVRPVNTTKE